MRLYIASSWRNESRVLALAQLLRSKGHEVDCFCDTSTGRYVFSAVKELPDGGRLTAPEFLFQPEAQHAYYEDKKWLDWCDGVVLILPSGKSAHLEGGYAKGQGKGLWILAPEGGWVVGEWDVMYGLADFLCGTTLELFGALSLYQSNGEQQAHANP